MKIYPNFQTAIKDSIFRLLSFGREIRPTHWQSMDVSNIPAATMQELLFLNFQVPFPGENHDILETLRHEIQPNLPWADKHFELERVSGEPINPGETWKEWPWANSADQFRTSGQFDHSYAERYWPRFAGYTPGGRIHLEPCVGNNQGIRSRVGDLGDIIGRLERDPGTRQAVLSVWHPEDQYDYGQRVPCSLTYQFLARGDRLHIIYNIRSCDAYRHFRDDLYLTSRLLLWVLMQLRKRDNSWDNMSPGFFVIQVGSFHCFINDIPQLEKWV
jgi:hypothetical protein